MPVSAADPSARPATPRHPLLPALGLLVATAACGLGTPLSAEQAAPPFPDDDGATVSEAMPRGGEPVADAPRDRTLPDRHVVVEVREEAEPAEAPLPPASAVVPRTALSDEDAVDREDVFREGSAGDGLGTVGVIGGSLGSRGTGLGGGGTAEGLGGLGTMGRHGGGLGSGLSAGSAGRVGRGAIGSSVGATRARREAPPRPDRTAPALRAGQTDDNEDFDAYLAFLGGWTDRPGLTGHYQPLAVQGRAWLDVTDPAGRPIPGVQITLTAPSGHRVHTATTYGDGRAPLYPHLALDGSPVGPGGTASAASPWTVTLSLPDGGPGATHTQAWDGTGDLAITLDHAAATARAALAQPDAQHQPPVPVPLDVAIVLDTTGSMSDELSRIKQTLGATLDRLDELQRPVDLRLSAVLYRDEGDAYVTRTAPLTHDLAQVDRFLQAARAGGGGDHPEAMNEALHATVDGLAWRQDAAQVAFLIADAPPQMGRGQVVPYGTTAARGLGQGLRIHTVAASGLREVGSLVMRQVAQLTRGEFVFIEYGGSVAASARSHGVADAEQMRSNNLDQILFDKLREEVDGWGVAPADRTVTSLAGTP